MGLCYWNPAEILVRKKTWLIPTPRRQPVYHENALTGLFMSFDNLHYLFDLLCVLLCSLVGIMFFNSFFLFSSVTTIRVQTATHTKGRRVQDLATSTITLVRWSVGRGPVGMATALDLGRDSARAVLVLDMTTKGVGQGSSPPSVGQTQRLDNRGPSGVQPMGYWSNQGRFVWTSGKDVPRDNRWCSNSTCRPKVRAQSTCVYQTATAVFRKEIIS